MRIAALSLFLVACSPPAEAPEEIGELSRYLFANYDAEAEVLTEGIAPLEAWLDTLDMSGSNDDRSVSLPTLTEDDVANVTGPDEDLTDQLPVAAAGASPHSIADHIALELEPNRVCIESDSTKYSTRTYTSDTACWADGSCDTLSMTNEVRKENLLAKVWYDMNVDTRTIELADGRTALLSRAVMPQRYEADGGNNSWDQFYALLVTLESADDSAQTVSMQAVWAALTLGGLGDDGLTNTIRDGVIEGLEYANGFMDADSDYCSNDRDREYDRE